MFTLQSLSLHCLLWCRYTNQKSARVQEGSGSPILPLLWGNKEFPVTPGLTFEGSLQAGVRESQFKQPLFEVAQVESRERMRVWSLFGSAWKKWLHLRFPTASVTANSYTCTSAPPLLNKRSQPQGLWWLKFNSGFTAAFSILMFGCFCMPTNGNKMTPMINSYALDLGIYCSVGVGGFRDERDLVPLKGDIKNLSNDHNAVARLWKTHVEIYRHEQCNSDERRPELLLPPARGGSANEAEDLERRGRVFATRTSRFMFLCVGGPALSLWAACVLWAQIWCFGWCLSGAV